MSTKHSPGPWEQEGRHVEALDGIEIIMGCEVYGPEEEAMANARLIAAAPELLEALTQITNAAAARENTMGDPCNLIAAREKLADTIRSARAAIAKATGE